MSDRVKEFWDNQATEFGVSDLATAPDHHYRELEISQILVALRSLLKERGMLVGTGLRVLDVGCGNGYSTLRFAAEFPHIAFVGVDYSAEMVRQANVAAEKAKMGTKVRFLEANVLDLEKLGTASTFDVVISERCIINLKDWNEQAAGILQMRKMLKPGGALVLVENSQEGLAELNSLRAGFGLHEIKTRWHNFYVPLSEAIPFLENHFDIEHRENIGNLYYIISRVVYAKLAQSEGKEPEYENPINEIASKLPTLGGYGYSPNFLFVLRHRSIDTAEAEMSERFLTKMKREIEDKDVPPIGSAPQWG